MRKLLAIAILAIAPFCVAQSFTTVTATSCIGLGDGSNLPAGTFQVQATDANDGDIPFRAGGAFQSLKQGVTRNVVNGSLSSSLQIGTPANSSPLDILYRITITDTSTKKVTVYRKVPISGTTWDFCAMDTGTLLPTIPHSVSVGPPGPAPTASNIQSALTSLSGCSDSGKAYNPQTNTCLPSAGGPTTVVYASQLATTPIASIVKGSSSAGAFDNASVLNAALAAMTSNFGRLVIDGKYAVGATLKIPSGVAVQCTPGNGLIELPNTNAPLFMNATSVTSPSSCAANVSDGLGGGGFIASHFCDHDIAIQGCYLNYNSTESITNSDHKTDSSNQWVPGIRILGVQRLSINDNIMWDSPTYNIATNNIQDFSIDRNEIGVPLVSGLPPWKNTDGIHLNGPFLNGDISGNFGQTGDDFIALNADDGYRPSTSDPNAVHVNWTGWTWGTGTDVTISGNNFQGSNTGIRLLSVGSRVDRIHILNNWGNTQDVAMQIDSPYAGGAGTPNFGCIDIDSFRVQRGTSTFESLPESIFVNGNFDCLAIHRPAFDGSVVNYPYFLQGSGTIQNLSISGANFFNTTGTQNTTSLIQTDGTVGSYVVTETNWQDNAGNTGALLGGTATPTSITVSGYSGPNRILASGYAPAHENGDAFTNTFPAATLTYVDTTFNEQTSGTALAGSTPATMAHGATGTWTAASGGPSSGAWHYSTNSVTLSGICTAGGPDIFCPVTIDAGCASTSNCVYRFTVGQFDSAIQFNPVLRWTDNANFVTLVSGGGSAWTLFDVDSGTTNVISAGTLGNTPGVYTIVMNGTSVTATGPSGSFTGTISSHNTSTKVGLNSNSAGAFTPAEIVTAFSVKSN